MKVKRGGDVLPILETGSSLQTIDRGELVRLYSHYKKKTNEEIRRAVLEYGRIDILATEVLGYLIAPHHLAMLLYEINHPKSLQLVFRGSGKTTICTVTKCIYYLLANPDLRIGLASKSAMNAATFLKEVKGHFEGNKRLEEIFGPYFDPRRVTKWDQKEIEVLPRRIKTKESSITTMSPESAVVSKHFDIIISDDLVDEENSYTKHARDKLFTWFYKSLDPCLMPPDPSVRFRGEHHILGTRYHNEDLYGVLMEAEFKGHTNIIPALDEEENSAWEDVYPKEFFLEKRETVGMIIFDSQYMVRTDSMKGEVFDYDDCQIIKDDDIPSGLSIYMGVDLAVTENDKNDQFAIVVIGEDRAGRIYVLDYLLEHISFVKQKGRTSELFRKWDPIRCGIEGNAYQKVLQEEVKAGEDEISGLRIVAIFTDKDKLARAWKLSPMFEAKRVFFRKNMGKLIEQFVLFPGARFKDGFDAFDIAIRSRKMRRGRKRREYEPGII